MRKVIKNKLKNTKLFLLALWMYNQFHLLKKTIRGTKKRFSLVSFKEFCFNNGYKYIIFETEMCRESLEPNYYGQKTTSTTIKEILPDIYYCELINAKVVGGNSFILHGDYCVNDIPFQNNSHNYNLKYGSVNEIDHERFEVDISYINNKERISKGITLVGHAANNYYHFTVDLLARLYYIDKIEEYKDYPLLIDDRACEYYAKLINAANMNNRKIIPIKRDVAYEVETLIFPSMVSWNPVYRVSSEYINSGNYYAEIPYLLYKDISNKIANKKTNSERKVFISRRDVSRKYLKNEIEVENTFRQHGFEIIAPGELDYNEQVRLFSEVTVLAGAEGAAFTNMVYMSEGAKIICIVPKAKNKYMVSSLSQVIGLECEYLDADLINENEHYMDLDYLENFLGECETYCT